jgi:hypothetical protein
MCDNARTNYALRFTLYALELQPQQMHVRHIVTYIIGGMEGLLLARLVLRLLAGRPDNPFVQVFLDVTEPLLTPLAFLDSGQPRYGATLELSTLALVILLALAGVAVGVLRRSADRSTQ